MFHRKKTKGVLTKLKLAEGLRYEVTHNVDGPDGLVNGAVGNLMKLDYRVANTTRPSIAWIEFETSSIGKKWRQKFPHLHTETTNNSWTPIMEVTVDFQVRQWINNKVIRRQFPLRPAAAKSIHRSQGETLKKFVIDLTCTRKTPALHYVGLSRGTNIQDLFILNLQEDKIHIDKEVHTEMARMHSHAQIKWSIPYFPCNGFPSLLSVIFHNVQSLHKYLKDVQSDPNIQVADTCMFVQARVIHTESDRPYNIKDFQYLYRNDIDSPHRTAYGTAVYSKIPLHDAMKLNFENNQVTSFVITKPQPLRILCIYRSPSHHDESSFA